MNVFEMAELMLNRFDIYEQMLKDGHELTYGGLSEYAFLKGFNACLREYLENDVTRMCAIWYDQYANASGSAFLR